MVREAGLEPDSSTNESSTRSQQAHNRIAQFPSKTGPNFERPCNSDTDAQQEPHSVSQPECAISVQRLPEAVRRGLENWHRLDAHDREQIIAAFDDATRPLFGEST